MKVLLQVLSFTELGLNCSTRYFCPMNGVWKDLIALVPRKGIAPAQEGWEWTPSIRCADSGVKCCDPNETSSVESDAGEHRLQGGEPRASGDRMLYSSEPARGMAAAEQGPRFSHVQLRQARVMLSHEGSPPRGTESSKSTVCNFLIYRPEKTLNFSFVLEI